MTKPVRDKPVRARALTQMKRILALGTATGVTIGLTHCSPMVADLPAPPLQCSAGEPPVYFSRWVHVNATWTTNDGGAAVVRVEITASSSGGKLGLSGTPMATGGTVSNFVNTGTDMTFEVTPDPGVFSVHLAVPLTCGKYSETFSGILELTGGQGDGGPLTFTPDQSAPADGGGGNG